MAPLTATWLVSEAMAPERVPCPEKEKTQKKNSMPILWPVWPVCPVIFLLLVGTLGWEHWLILFCRSFFLYYWYSKTLTNFDAASLSYRLDLELERRVRMPFLLIVSFLAIFVEAVPDHWKDNNWLAAALKYRWLKSVPRLPTIESSESPCGELVGEVTCVTATTVFGVVIPISPTTIPLEPEGTTTILELTTVTVANTLPISPAESSSRIESTSQVVEHTTSGEPERTTSTASSAPPISSAMAGSTISSQATSFATFTSSVLDRSESTTSSLFSAAQSSSPSSTLSSNSLNSTIPVNGIDSPSASLSLDAKVGICSAGVMFFLFVLVSSIYFIRKLRQQRRDPSQYQHRNIPIEEEPIEMPRYPYGLGTTLARCFSRPYTEKPLSRSQPMSAMSNMSHYASPHIAADSTTMISSWAPTKAMRRYDCVILSPEAQELHEHTQYVQESLDERDDGSPSFSETSGQSIVEGYSVLGDGASKEAARASTICTLGARSEVDSAVVGGTW